MKNRLVLCEPNFFFFFFFLPFFQEGENFLSKNSLLLCATTYKDEVCMCCTFVTKSNTKEKKRDVKIALLFILRSTEHVQQIGISHVPSLHRGLQCGQTVAVFGGDIRAFSGD